MHFFRTLVAVLLLTASFCAFGSDTNLMIVDAIPIKKKSAEQVSYFSKKYSEYELYDINLSRINEFIINKNNSFQMHFKLGSTEVKNYTLYSNNLKAKNFVLRVGTDSGVKAAQTPIISTLAGYSNVDVGQEIRMTISQEYFSIAGSDKKGRGYYMQLVDGSKKKNGRATIVVFKSKDLLPREKKKFCDMEDFVQNKILSANNKNRKSPDAACIDTEIAIIADFKAFMGLGWGKLDKCVFHIIEYLNFADWKFDDMDINYTLVELYVQIANSDPWCIGGKAAHLTCVLDWANAGGTVNSWDVISFWTDSGHDTSMAWASSVCTSNGGTILEVDGGPDDLAFHGNLQAHELGHAWGSGHRSTPLNIMFPTVPNIASSIWADQSKQEVNAHRNANPSCFETCRTLDAAIITIVNPYPISLNCRQPTEIKVRLRNDGLINLTSASVRYKVDGGPTKSYNWTGDLEAGKTDDISLELSIFATGSHSIEAWTESPNGGIDEYPTNDRTSLDFEYSTNALLYRVEVIADGKPTENSWDVKDESGAIVEQGGPFPVISGVFDNVFCLEKGQCYDFTIYDSGGNGLTEPEGEYNIYNEGDFLIVEGGIGVDFGSEKSHNDFFCPGCKIIAITPSTQTACNTTTNKYDQELIVTYDEAPSTGKIEVNGQQFPISGSPQTITLTNLHSDGKPVDVSVGFTDDPVCVVTKTEAFVAAEVCTPCSIDDVILGTQTECKPETSTYNQELTIKYSGKIPSEGKLDVNGQLFGFTDAGELNVTLFGLDADGLDVDLIVKFTDKEDCSLSRSAFFTAPDPCELKCVIDSIVMGSQTACDPIHNSYQQTFTLHYTHNPTTGYLIINEREYLITESPQEVTMTGLDADGALLSVDLHFSDFTTCIGNVTFNAPASCITPCSITGVTTLEQTECNQQTNEYSQALEITYTDPPNSGNLIVNGQYFGLSGSPQKVELTNLASDGASVDVSILFSDDDSCPLSSLALFTAPISCSSSACSIDDIVVGEQSICNLLTNQYSQDLTIHYSQPSSGVLLVNDQPFTITGSPQTITLGNLDADGANIDVTVKFTGDESCTLTKTALFSSPVNCEFIPCSIEKLELGTQSSCDALTNKYSQEVIIHYNNPPSTGKLIVNNIEHDITGSPQTVLLDTLLANSLPVNVNVSFSEDEGCSILSPSFFTAPANCVVIPCEITQIETATQSTCDPTTNLYSQDLVIHYKGAPNIGTLDINDQPFGITNSPQTITLVDLLSDGKSVDISTSFSGNANCSQDVSSVFSAPESCLPCNITGVTAGLQSNCDPVSGNYVQQLTITYLNPPSSGTLDVNGQSFEIKQSPQKIVLNDLTSNGTAVNVTVQFSADSNCKLEETALFTAPTDCFDPNICKLQKLEALSQIACDPSTNTYGQELRITYNGAPATGQLIINGQFFGIQSSPQVVTLTNLIPDGLPVNVTALFSDEADCALEVKDLFTASLPCISLCKVKDIKVGVQGNCDAQKLFSQEIIIEYENAPNSGNLQVNGNTVPITTSPQSVTLQSLSVQGKLPFDVTAFFSDDQSCQAVKNSLFLAPDDCFIGVASSEKAIFNYYPNPSNGRIHFEAGAIQSNEVSIQVIDIQGKRMETYHEKVYQGKLNKEFDFTHFSKGVYFIKVISTTSVYMNKITLQ